MSRGLVGTSLVALVACTAASALAAYPAAAHSGAYARAPQQAGYVKLDAPMYPVPQPNIPWQVGGTMYTNQAFYAHEMLYPHHYRALYPPYYWNVYSGKFGEHWQLRGTMVDVQYKSHISPFSLFTPPSTR